MTTSRLCLDERETLFWLPLCFFRLPFLPHIMTHATAPPTEESNDSNDVHDAMHS